MTFPLQRNPSVSSAGYHMEPPPPYPGPSAPPPPPDLQPFYLWSGAALPGQVPVMMESPRSFPQYPSHPPPPLPPRSQYGPPVQAANTAQVRCYIRAVQGMLIKLARVYVFCSRYLVTGRGPAHVTKVSSFGSLTIIIATRGCAR